MSEKLTARDRKVMAQAARGEVVYDAADTFRRALVEIDRLTTEVDRLVRSSAHLKGAPCLQKECPTWHDGCHCTVEQLAFTMDRADVAEAERDKALAEREDGA